MDEQDIPDIDSLVLNITEELRRLGKGSRQGHRPSAQTDFGVYTGDLRGVVRRYGKAIADLSGDIVYGLALRLIARNVTECRQVAYELIYGHREARVFLDRERVERLGNGIDNWACVDLFCANISGPAWRNGLLPDSAVMRWSSSDDLWWRRAAVVSSVCLNVKSRGGTGDAVRTLAVCRALLADREEMVQKGVSWALRELVPWDRQAVRNFLDEHDRQVSARVKREVRRKLETGRK